MYAFNLQIYMKIARILFSASSLCASTVGAMSSGEVQNVSGESIGMRQAHLARIEEKAKKMIKTRFAKHLKDFPHAVKMICVDSSKGG